MKIVLDPALLEEVILSEIKRQEDIGDLRYFNQYRQRADIIYDLYQSDQPEEREIQFQRLHEKLFFKWGFANSIIEAIDEFTDLVKTIELIVVKKAVSKTEEAADLIIEPSDTHIDINIKGKAIGLKLLAARFEDPKSLRKFLRHELMHISDMLDAEFGYKLQRLADSPMEENIIRDRYKILWDIYIDSRLECFESEKKSLSTKDQRYSEFEALYKKLNPIQVKNIFDSLWDLKKLSHDEIVEMSKDTAEFLKHLKKKSMNMNLTGSNDIDNPKTEANPILPGSKCPLCGFPSYYWYHWPEETDQLLQVVEKIKEDFPNWQAEDGCCERCAERYIMQSSQQSAIS